MARLPPQDVFLSAVNDPSTLFRLEFMKGPVSSILVICKSCDQKARDLGLTIREWLSERGVACRLAENRSSQECEAPGRAPQLALVLGGDGTMLSEARQASATGLPLLGLNLGRVGFLTGLDPDNWREALGDIIVHGFDVVKRIMLDVRVKRQGEDVFSCLAVNDLVVSRGAVARLIELEVAYGPERVCRVRADGVVISTPTGSTAYCVSAGGPLIHPDLDVLCLTPVCPFLNDFRPFVVPASRPLAVTVSDKAGVYLTADGQEQFPLRYGDVVIASRAERGFSLVDRRGDSYFNRLRRKGFVKDQ